MDILNSDWLIHMLQKAGKTPQARMLSLFDILDDWLNAPGVQVHIEQYQSKHQLQNFLAVEAAKAGAAQPEMLATQLVLMAMAASNQKLEAAQQASNQSTSSDALVHAKGAAEALIAAQTTQPLRVARPVAYATAASLLVAMALAGHFWLHQTPAAQVAQTAPQVDAMPNARVEVNTAATPQQTAALIAQIEQMRKGSCQLPEALQLPDAYKQVYFDNIVSGQISTNASDQKLVHELLKMVRCNYTPMLMANSKG